MITEFVSKHPRITGFAAGLLLTLFASSQVDRVHHLAAMGEQGPALVDTFIGLLGLAIMTKNLIK